LCAAWWLGYHAEDTISKRRLQLPSGEATIEEIPFDSALYTKYQKQQKKTDPLQRKTSSAKKKPVSTEGLIEVSSYGALPRISKSGLEARKAYAASNKHREEAYLCLIFEGAGLNPPLLEQALRTLPHPVAFAFSPYGQDLDVAMSSVRAAGHEALLLIPMEPADYPLRDPGGRALMTKMETAQNTERLLWFLGRGIGYTGVMPFLGDAFTETPWRIDPILRVLAERGLLFMDNTSLKGKKITQALSRNLQVAYAPTTEDGRTLTDAPAITALLRRLSPKKTAVVVLPFTLPAITGAATFLGNHEFGDGILLPPSAIVTVADVHH